MAGLMNAAQPVGMSPNVATATPPGGSTPPPSGDSQGVSKEEQKQYDEFVTNGMKVLHDESGLDAVTQSLSGDGNPIEGLANTVVSIVIRLQDSAKQAGHEISGDVVMQGGAEIMEQAVELSEEAGIHKFSEEDMESAMYMAMDLYRSSRGEQDGQQNNFTADLQELQGMEQAGTLEQEFPGITEHSQKAAAKAGPGAGPGNAPPQPILPG